MKGMNSLSEPSALADNHEHEKRGIDAIEASTTLDAQTARRILTDLLQPMHDGLLPAPLYTQVIEGLESFEFGEPTSIFQPTLRGAKRGYRALRLQLKGLGHVEFRRHRGLKKESAQEQVAKAYGVGSDAVRGWEHRLKVKLGEPLVSKSLHLAKYLASDDRRAHLAQSLFSDEMLRLDGQAFQADLLKAAGATERSRSVAKKSYTENTSK
jgi:hypothetical protein